MLIGSEKLHKAGLGLRSEVSKIRSRLLVGRPEVLNGGAASGDVATTA
jgi:hypothetical protein